MFAFLDCGKCRRTKTEHNRNVDAFGIMAHDDDEAIRPVQYKSSRLLYIIHVSNLFKSNW